jgi:hypothetical protein
MKYKNKDLDPCFFSKNDKSVNKLEWMVDPIHAILDMIPSRRKEERENWYQS